MLFILVVFNGLKEKGRDNSKKRVKRKGGFEEGERGTLRLVAFCFDWYQHFDRSRKISLIDCYLNS